MVAGSGITMTHASLGREVTGLRSCRGLHPTTNMNGIRKHAGSSIKKPESRFTHGKSL